MQVNLRALRPLWQATTYGVGRSASVLAQIILIALLTRTLDREDVGRLSVALAVSALTGLFFGLSARRLATYRAEGENLADLQVATMTGALVSLAVSYVACAAAADARAAHFGVVFTAWRAADAYGEIGQGVLCRRRQFRRASILTAARAGASTLSAGLLIALGWDVLLALWVGAGVRMCAAAMELAIANCAMASRLVLADLWRTLSFGTYLSLVGVLILLIDTLPTVLIARLGGLEAAAVVAPLGRLRYGVSIIATTLGEIVYVDMLDVRQSPRQVLRLCLRGSLYFLPIAVGVTALFAASFAELLFGRILEGQGELVALAMAAGTALGVTTMVSSGLTAQQKVGVQVAGYALNAAVAVYVTWISNWSARGMYMGQLVGSLLALALLIALGYLPAKGADTEASA